MKCLPLLILLFCYFTSIDLNAKCNFSFDQTTTHQACNIVLSYTVSKASISFRNFINSTILRSNAFSCFLSICSNEIIDSKFNHYRHFNTCNSQAIIVQEYEVILIEESNCIITKMV